MCGKFQRKSFIFFSNVRSLLVLLLFFNFNRLLLIEGNTVDFYILTLFPLTLLTSFILADIPAIPGDLQYKQCQFAPFFGGNNF